VSEDAVGDLRTILDDAGPIKAEVFGTADASGPDDAPDREHDHEDHNREDDDRRDRNLGDRNHGNPRYRFTDGARRGGIGSVSFRDRRCAVQQTGQHSPDQEVLVMVRRPAG
jgi:hypothetical protein